MNKTDAPVLSRQNQILDSLLFSYLGDDMRNNELCNLLLMPVKESFLAGRDLALLLWAEGGMIRGNISEAYMKELISNSRHDNPAKIPEINPRDEETKYKIHSALKAVMSFGTFLGEKLYDYSMARAEEFSKREYSIDGIKLRPSYEKLLDELVVLLRSQSDKILERYGISEGAFYSREIPPFRGVIMYFEAPPPDREWLGFSGGVSITHERGYRLVSIPN